MTEIKRRADVVIVGGGASGLAAAITLRMKKDISVLVIEKMAEPARKIRATGSGRCNISNTEAPDYMDIVGFFAGIGLMTRSYENGLVYPYSESAKDVAEILIRRTKQLGAVIACGEEVISVKKAAGSGFEVLSKYKDENGEHKICTEASYVILACGGKAGPMYGTTGDGYRLAKSLGHSIVTPVPALTGIECSEWSEESEPRAIIMAGTRTRGVVRLYKKGSDESKQMIFEEEGEIQFTKYGLSGICIFNMTRHMRFNSEKGESLSDFIITLDLCPGKDMKKVLNARRERALPGESTDMALTGILKENPANYVINSASLKAAGKHIGEITDDEIEAISEAMQAMTFHPEKLRGWKDAQVTSGGVSLDEIDEETSASKVADGLYITGELADKDFQCGGFNLSNAWLSGMGAARDIAAGCKAAEK